MCRDFLELFASQTPDGEPRKSVCVFLFYLWVAPVPPTAILFLFVPCVCDLSSFLNLDIACIYLREMPFMIFCFDLHVVLFGPFFLSSVFIGMDYLRL